MVSGRELQRHLIVLGVKAQKVVCKRDTGHYVADFFIPNMKEPISPADEWAMRIQSVLPDARIIDTSDMVAQWREGQPVICATVTFKWSHA